MLILVFVVRHPIVDIGGRLYQKSESGNPARAQDFSCDRIGGGVVSHIETETETDRKISLSPESKFIVICRWRNSSLFAGIFELASLALRDFFFFSKFILSKSLFCVHR